MAINWRFQFCYKENLLINVFWKLNKLLKKNSEKINKIYIESKYKMDGDDDKWKCQKLTVGRQWPPWPKHHIVDCKFYFLQPLELKRNINIKRWRNIFKRLFYPFAITEFSLVSKHSPWLCNTIWVAGN